MLGIAKRNSPFFREIVFQTVIRACCDGPRRRKPNLRAGVCDMRRWWMLPIQLQVCCWTVLTLLCLWLQFWAGATPLGYVGFGFGIARLIQLLRGRRRMHQITAVFSVVSAAISDV